MPCPATGRLALLGAPSSSTRSLPAPRPHTAFSRTPWHPARVRPGPWGTPEGLVGSCRERLSSHGFQALRVAGQSPDRSAPFCLRAERVGCSLGRPGPQPGWQGVGAKRPAPKLQALQRDVGGGSSAETLYGFPAGRGTWLRKPLSPYNGLGWDL